MTAESCPDCMVLLGADGRILDCNQQASQLLGYPRDTLLGRQGYDFLAEQEKAARIARLTSLQLARKGRAEGTLAVRRSAGPPLFLWTRMLPRHDSPEAAGQSVACFRDVTTIRQLDQAKDEIIALVSHELRTPLTVIVGALHTLLTERGRLSFEDTLSLLQDAYLEAQDMSQLVANLLDLARIQSHRLSLNTVPLRPVDVATATVSRARQHHPAHRFEIRVGDDLPAIPADKVCLEHILYNLLDNAAKYSPEGSTVVLEGRVEEGQLVLRVTDSGPGITPEDQARLFTRFQRLERSRLRITEGIGLGLVVCRRLVEAHGGRIWVKSAPGQGSTFFISLPLHPRLRH